MCLRAYAIIFLTCPKKNIPPNSSTCITKVLFVFGVSQLGLEGNVGGNLHEPFPHPTNRKWWSTRNQWSFFDANPRGRVLQNTAEDPLFKLLASNPWNLSPWWDSSEGNQGPKDGKRPTTPTNQHQPPNHHILGLKQQLTTSITTGLATHLCDQLVTAVNCCHRRNYLGLGKSDGCINQQLEIR